MATRAGAVSRCSIPSSTGREPAASPPLFECRCSSPLQLNLLQLEDSMAPHSGAPGSSIAAEKCLAAQPEEDPTAGETPVIEEERMCYKFKQ